MQFIVGVLCRLLMTAGQDQNAQSKALFASTVYVSRETGEADRGKNNITLFFFFFLNCISQCLFIGTLRCSINI